MCCSLLLGKVIDWKLDWMLTFALIAECSLLLGKVIDWKLRHTLMRTPRVFVPFY